MVYEAMLEQGLRVSRKKELNAIYPKLVGRFRKEFKNKYIGFLAILFFLGFLRKPTSPIRAGIFWQLLRYIITALRRHIL